MHSTSVKNGAKGQKTNNTNTNISSALLLEFAVGLAASQKVHEQISFEGFVHTEHEFLNITVI